MLGRCVGDQESGILPISSIKNIGLLVRRLQCDVIPLLLALREGFERD